MEKRWYSISPGTMGVVAMVYKLIGPNNMHPGQWPGPVFINATEEELMVVMDLLNQLDSSVKWKAVQRQGES